MSLYFAKLRGAAYRYGIAVLCVLAAAAFRLIALNALGSRLIYITFFPAVILAALFGGIYAGFLATALSAAASLWWMDPSHNYFRERSPADLLGFIVFILTCTMISIVCEFMHKAQVRAAKADSLAKIASERQSAEEAARASEAKYRFLSENTGDVIWLLDLDLHRFVYVNPAVTRLRGYTPSEVLTQSMQEVLTPASYTMVSESLPSRIASLESGDNSVRVQMHEVDQIHKDGSFVHTEVVTTLLQNDAGKVKQIIGISRDISERRKTEDALRRSEANLRLAMDAAMAGIWEWDVQTNKNIWSDELWKVYGMEPFSCEPSYEAWLQSVHPDDRRIAEETVSRAVEMETELNAEWRVLDRDGSERWLLSRGRPVRSPEGRVLRFIGIVMDVTQLKHAESELRRSLDEKISLLKEVHHRVKNNLQIVESLLDLQSSRTHAPDANFALQETRNRVRSMGLLHETLYRSGNFASTNFSAYVDELCIQLFGSFGISTDRIKLKNLVAEIGIPLEQAVPCGLIINELVSNALKHGFPDERQGTITVEFYPNEPSALTLRITDDGIGLPRSIDPTQAHTLGLQLVRNLADQLRGRLSFEPGKTSGIVCTIVFPNPKIIRNDGEL